uniref:PABS domain-containing protein n=2 Tax=Opuntia streptacantha TaxID=393608 RepID=A0A7C8YQH4_OPUST
MVSAGLTTLSSCNYDLLNAVNGRKDMRVLCIGHGGGSLPLFLASKIKGAVIDIVEIDPLVISASIHAMGFPSFSVIHSSHCARSPNTIDEVLWRGIHERLFLYESDAEKFILNRGNLYDIIFIDAYDGDDVFPRKLWDPDYPFLKALSSSLHPCHGTVVVNLHSDADVLDPDVFIASNFEPVLPMGRYVSEVCQAYKDMLVGKQRSFSQKQCAGLGFAVSVPWVCNTTLVVCRGFCVSSGALHRDSVLNALISKSLEVDRDLDLPFSCLQYLKRGFVLLS